MNSGDVIRIIVNSRVGCLCGLNIENLYQDVTELKTLSSVPIPPFMCV